TGDAEAGAERAHEIEHRTCFAGKRRRCDLDCPVSVGWDEHAKPGAEKGQGSGAEMPACVRNGYNDCHDEKGGDAKSHSRSAEQRRAEPVAERAAEWRNQSESDRNDCQSKAGHLRTVAIAMHQRK